MKSTISTKMTEYSYSDNGATVFQSRVRQQQSQINYLNKIIEVKDFAIKSLHKIFTEEIKVSKQNLATCQNIISLLEQQLIFASNSADYSLTTDVKAQLEGLSYQYLSCFKREELGLMHWHDDQLRILKNTTVGQHQIKKDFTMLSKIKKGSASEQEIYWELPSKVISQLDTRNTLPIKETPPSTLENLNIIDEEAPVSLAEKNKNVSHIVQIPVKIIEVHEIPYEVIQIYEVPSEIRRRVQIPVELQLVDDEEESFQQAQEQSEALKQLSQLRKHNQDSMLKIDRLGQQIEYLKQKNKELIAAIERRQEEVPYNFVLELGETVVQVSEDQLNQNHEYEIPLQIIVDNNSAKSVSVVIGGKEEKHPLQLLSQQTKNEQSNSLIDSNRMVAQGLIYEEGQIARLKSCQRNFNQIQCQVEEQASQIPNEDSQVATIDQEAQTDFQIEPVFKEIYIDRPVIYEMPMELVTEVQTTIIQEVPVEMYIQVPVIHQVPVELQVEKIVEKEIIVQREKIVEKQVIIQKEVIVEKEVFIEKKEDGVNSLQQFEQKHNSSPRSTSRRPQPQKEFVYVKIPVIKDNIIEVIKEVQICRQIPVDRIVIKQVPVEVVVIKEIPVEVKVIQQVPVQVIVIKEVPTQVIVFEQVIRTVEVPIVKEIFVDRVVEKEVVIQKQIVKEVPVYYFDNNQQQNVDVLKGMAVSEPRTTFAETYRSYPMQSTGRASRSVSFFELPVELQVERVVEVEKIVEIERIVEKMVQIEKTIEKLVEVVQIVEIPIQLEFERVIEIENTIEITKTEEVVVTETVQFQVQKIVPFIVEIPVEISFQKDQHNDQRGSIILKTKIPEDEPQDSEMSKELSPRAEIYQVPVQCVIERIVEVERIIEVPKVVEVEKIIEIPKLIQVEKIVEIQKPVQVERTVEKIIQVQKVVYVERIVEVQKIKQIQIQVPTLVEVFRDHEIETNSYNMQGIAFQSRPQTSRNLQILEIPVQIEIERPFSLPEKEVIQVFVEKIVEKEKLVEKIVEIPVELVVYQQIEKPIIQERIIQKKVEKIVQIPVQMIVHIPGETVQVQKIVQKQIIRQVEVLKEIEVIKQVEVIRQVEVIKQVEVIRQVEVIKEVEVVKQVEIIKEVEVIKEVQVIKEVDRVKEIEIVKEVPREIIIEKIVQVERPVPFIIEVPLELQVQVQSYHIIEVPVQLEFQPQVYEVPIEMYTPLEVLQIPIELKEDTSPVPNGAVEPTYAATEPTNGAVEPIKEEVGPKFQAHSQQSIKPQLMLRIEPHLINIEVVPTKLEENKATETLEAALAANLFKHEPAQLAEPEERNPLMDFDELNKLSQINKVENNMKLESNSEKEFKGAVQSFLKVWQIPVQLELDFNKEQIQRQIQHKYKEQYTLLNHKYQNQIAELHTTIEDIQKIVLELNQKNSEMMETLEARALREESLIQRINRLQSQFEEERERLRDENERKSLIIQHQKEEYENLQYKIRQMLSNQMLRELPVELQLEIETEENAVQTDELNLFMGVDVLEVPVIIEVGKVFEQTSLIKVEESQRESASSKGKESLVNIEFQETIPLPQKKNNTREENNNVLQYLNSEKQNEPQSEVHDQQSRQYAKQQIKKVLDELYSSQKFKTVDEVQSFYNGNLVSVIDFAEEYQNIIERHAQIYEIATEIMSEPIVYEVPVDIRDKVQTTEAETQTEDVQRQSNTSYSYPQIIEMPVEVIVNKDDSSYSLPSMPLYNRQANPHGKKDRHLDASSKGEKMALTDSDSNILAKQELQLYNKIKNKILQDKPYSQFYKSRGIEFPMELELSHDHLNFEIQTILHNFRHTESQTEFTLDIITTDHMHQLHAERFRITPAYEPMAISVRKQIITTIDQDKETIKLHSLCSIANSNNDNNVEYEQSYSPRKMIESNSWEARSKLKKSESGPKLLGEDMIKEGDDNIGAQPSQMSNKKYMGFEFPESSIQNITYNREMIIEDSLESIHEQEKEINPLQSPNLDPFDVNFSDFAFAKDKIFEAEDWKNRFQQLYYNALAEIQQSKQVIRHRDDEIYRLKNLMETQTAKHEEELKKVYIEVATLQKGKRENQSLMEEQKLLIDEYVQTREKLQEKLDKLIEGYDKLKEDSDKIEARLANENEKLKNIIHDQKQEIKEMRTDEHHNKQYFTQQLNELTELLKSKDENIERLESQLLKRQEQYEHLLHSHQEMRKNIAELNRQQEVDPTELYEREFNRIRQMFEEEKERLEREIMVLQNELEGQKMETQEKVEAIEELKVQIQQLNNAVQEARRQNSQLHHVKSQIQSNYISGVRELQEIREVIRQKNEIITRYEATKNIKDIAAEPQQASPAAYDGIKIEYLSNKSSRVQDRQDLEGHIRDLEEVIIRYEQMLVADQRSIQEYQDKVCEYLRDALEKQQESEALFTKLVEYQNTINNILVDKVTLEIENKQLLRTIELSERKIEVLGNRLIETVRRRAEHQWESKSDRYYEG